GERGHGAERIDNHAHIAERRRRGADGLQSTLKASGWRRSAPDPFRSFVDGEDKEQGDNRADRDSPARTAGLRDPWFDPWSHRLRNQAASAWRQFVISPARSLVHALRSIPGDFNRP